MSYKYLLCKTEMTSLESASLGELQNVDCSVFEAMQLIDKLIGAAKWSDEDGVFFGYGPKPEHRYEIWIQMKDFFSISVSGLSDEGLRVLSKGMSLALFDCQTGERLDLKTGF